MTSYDVVVIGLGTMGSAAACDCARRGKKVLGLDANPPHHALGSSHGATRAIRETYFESPDYVPLALRAHDLWRQLETQTGKPLLSTHGAVYVAPQGHGMLKGVTTAAERHGLALERLSHADMAKRFPGFCLPQGWQGLFEPGGGVLQAEDCIAAHRSLARRHGADLRFGVEARNWSQGPGGGIVIDTDAGELEAASAIVTVGPWACEALAELDLPISGRRISIIHLDAADAGRYDARDMSVYFWATPEGVFAGFPHFDGEGVKIMRHDAGEVCTPDTVRRDVSAADIAEITGFADRYMPQAHGGVRSSLVGIYTMTPDNHFIIDRHPKFQNLVYATGFSGHGFKFTPVIGEILADLALDGSTRHPIGFLSADRFRQPAAKSA